MNNRKKFNFRAFISLYVLISFLLISFSGIVLYFSPPGRVANWSYWEFLGLYKRDWQALHTIFTFLFIAAAAFHIFFNWKPVIHYLKTKMQSVLIINRELLGASILVIIIFVMTINSLPPFVYVMDIGEDLSGSWSNESTEPPVPHAELLSLTEFAKTIGKEKEAVISKLKESNIKGISDTVIISDLAVMNQMTPQQIYSIASADFMHVPGAGTGRGLGRKSLAEICSENQIDITETLAFLKSQGIEAGENETVKDVAQREDKLPFEIVDLILTQKK